MPKIKKEKDVKKSPKGDDNFENLQLKKNVLQS